MEQFYKVLSLTLLGLVLIITFPGFQVLAAGPVPNCTTAQLPATGGTLASPATSFTWNAPTGTVTGYKIYIGTSAAANELVNGANVTTASYIYNGSTLLNCGTIYYWQVVPYNANGSATGCAVQTFTIIAVGNPSVFPIGSWNAYCYNSVDWTNYTGYYTAAGQNFNSTATWNTSYSPSAASPNGATTYQGCGIPNDYHSIIYKRQGFTAGTYSLDVLNDDACYLYLNGNLIYSKGTWTATPITSVWTGNLDASSQIEFRWTEGTGSSNGAITFNTVTTPTLVPGSISGDQTMCSGNDPYVFKNVTAGSGTCGSIAYQWQQDAGCTGSWSDIAAATAATYDVPAGITRTTCYRRALVDPNCNRTSYTNTVTVTITAVQQGNPSVFPLNTWNGYVYDFTNTGYTSTDDNWTDYKGYFSYTGTSAADPGFYSSTDIYTAASPPSAAPGYAGCQVTGPLSGVQFKRQGFPTGTYQIDFDSDDAGYLYINGVLVYGRTGCCAVVTNVWTGNLDASSKIEYHYKNNGGNGFGRIVITAVTPIPIDGGNVASSASSVICSGDTPPAFISNTLASGGCTKAGYQWQADAGSGFTDISGATNTTYGPTNVTATTSYRRKYIDICSVSGYSNTVTLTVGTPTLPIPAFGSNTWNAYVYNFASTGYTGTDDNWTDYKGYFTYNGLSFNTGTIYGNNTAPSYAPGYYGCQVGQALSGVQLKRQGFPAGTYQIDFNSDDAGYVYINGVLVFGRTGCCTAVPNIWTGNLDVSSTIDFHYKNNGSSGYGILTFTLVTPTTPLDPGVVANNNSSTVCSGNTLPPFVSTTDATSGCYIYYQWELNTGSGWSAISGATGKTYTPANVTVSSSYRRKATDACTAAAYSNTLALTVATVSSATLVFGNNTWNAYVYDFGVTNPTGNGAFTANNTGWLNNSGTFQTPGISTANPGFNTSPSLYNFTDPPSYAPGYQGCQVGNIQNGVIFKRQGFPVATYQLDFTSDDPGYLFVNGTLVSSRTTNGTNTNAWTGSLNSTSTVEFRYKNNGGNGNGILTFTVINSTLPLVPAVIAAAQTICEATAPAAFTTATAATSGCTVFYQWQSSTASATGPWTAISGATNTTYTSPVLSQTTYFSQAVTDGCGASGVSNAIKVTVNPLPLATGTITGSATFCPSQTGVAYSIPAVTNATGYTWTLPTGATIASGPGTNSITVNFATTSGTITVKPTNACGSGTISSIAVNMTALPGNAGAFTTSSATACSGQTGVVYTIAAVTGATTYAWTVPTGAIITAGNNTNSITVTFGSVSGNVSVAPTNVCGTGTAKSIAVTVNTVPAAAGAITGLTDVCKTSTPSLTYKITGVTGATSYSWTVPSGVTITSGSTTNSITVTFTLSSVSGNFVVTPINTCGNGTSSTLAVTVSTVPPVAAGAITGTSTACAGALGLVYSVGAVTGATGYSWTTPVGTTIVLGSNTNSITVNLGSTSGSFSVIPTNACGSGASSIAYPVTVNPYPSTAGAITGNTTVCAGTSQSYSIPLVTNATGYTWALPAGSTITAGANTRSITATMGSTSGSVTVTPTNGCGNGTSNTIAITVNAAPSAAGAISGLTEVCKSTTGVTYSIAAINGAATYTWTVPTGITITSGAGTNSITVNFATPASPANISVVPSNTCGAGTGSSLSIVVPTSVSSAAGSITGSATSCATATGMVYSISAATGASGYNWTVPAGATITAGAGTNSITVTMGTTSGSVTATPINACGNGTQASKTITISGAPPATVGSITGLISVCKGQPRVTYSIATVGGATSYSWTVPTGVTINSGAGTTSIVVSYTGASVSSGLITANATNTCGTTSNSITITINSYCVNTWTGVATTDWSLSSNWSLGSVPTSTDDVIIPSSVASGRMPVVSSVVNAHDITDNGTITIASAGTLNIYGNIVNNSTSNILSGSTLVFRGSGAQTISGIPTLYNVTINNAAGVTLSSGAANALKIKATLLLTAGTLTTNSNLTIDVDNGGNIGYTPGDAGAVSGNVTIFRAINSITTHYFSCPLDGVQENDLADNTQVINPTTTKTRLFHYDNTAHTWLGDYNMTDILSPSNAYSMWFPALTTIDFTGTYNHAANYTYSSPNVATKFMFVSNPYPSTLDWEASSGWTKTGIKNAVYFWNPTTNSYASYISGQGTNSATQYIPVMNSFFVAYDGNASVPTATVSMNNNVRSSTYKAMWRTKSDETIRLTLKSSTAADEAVIRFNDEATNDFDNELDAYKFLNASSIPSIYTMNGSIKYSINSISSPYAKDTIPVMIKIPADGDYVLSIKNSDPTVEYILVDKKLGTETPVTTKDYSFTALKTDSINRFDLQMRQVQVIATGVQQASAISGLQILSSPNGFLVKSTVSGICSIEIIDAAGNRVKTLTNVSLTNGNNFFTPEIAAGIYVLKVNMNNISCVGQVSIIK